MRRRTLDIIVSSGALALAALLAIVGYVLVDNATFSRDYVSEQLSQQKITFPEEADINDRDREFSESRTGCLVAFAGQAVTTGRHAECYGNEYIGSHLSYLATRLEMPQIAYADGLTYVELGGVQGELRAEIAAAETADDPGLPKLEQELADITTLRTKMFEGNMLRNALLTSYGFSVLGEKAAQAANIVFVAAVVLALLAIAGFAHAALTPRSRAFAPVDAAALQKPAHEKELVGV